MSGELLHRTVDESTPWAVLDGVNSPPPPDELKQLDFLLGDWKCTVNVRRPNLPAVSFDVMCRVFPVLGGHWYQWDSVRLASETLPATLYGRWLFGWNPIAAEFTALYADDQDGHALETSPGFDGGHLTFSGPVVSKEGAFTFREDFEPIDDDHFVYTSSMLIDGAWIARGVGDCRRL